MGDKAGYKNGGLALVKMAGFLEFFAIRELDLARSLGGEGSVAFHQVAILFFGVGRADTVPHY
jgi:hypothetical protein